MGKQIKEPPEAAIQAAAAAFARVGSPAAMRRFFDEILTPGEKRTIALRWRLLQRLYEGATQRAVAGELGVSLCKITRGAKILKDKASVTARLLSEEE